MIRYQLPTGKTVVLTAQQYLNLLEDDEKLQELIAQDRGIFVEDPFKSLNLKDFVEFEDILEVDIEDLPENEINNIKKEFDGSE